MHEITFVKIDEVPYFISDLMSKPVIWDDYVDMDLAIVLCRKEDIRGTFAALVCVQYRLKDIVDCKLLVCVSIMSNSKKHRSLEKTVFTRTSLVGKSQK